MKPMFLSLLSLMILSGCKIISNDELTNLLNPQTNVLETVPALITQKINPYVMTHAKNLATLIEEINASHDFDEACRTYGYRAQAAFPCGFWVKTEATISALKTQSRTGKIQITLTDSTFDIPLAVQIGPVFKGTALRDAYPEIKYGDYNDQAIFGEIAKKINNEVITTLPLNQLAIGKKVQVYGVIHAWDGFSTQEILITPLQLRILED